MLAILCFITSESLVYALFVADDVGELLEVPYLWVYPSMIIIGMSGTRLTFIALGFLYFKKARDPLAGV
jgi:hypothetical protein